MQNPIVVEVGGQPPVTPEISYGSVLLSAVQLVGLVVGAALCVGAVIGAIVIMRKRRRERTDAHAGESSHVRLRI